VESYEACERTVVVLGKGESTSLGLKGLSMNTSQVLGKVRHSLGSWNREYVDLSLHGTRSRRKFTRTRMLYISLMFG